MASPIFLSNEDDYCVLRDAAEMNASATIGPARLAHCDELVFYVVFGPKSMGGSVVLEGAHSSGHAGEWARLALVNYLSPGRVHYVGLTGTHLAIRVRVLDAVMGDTVSVFGIGN